MEKKGDSRKPKGGRRTRVDDIVRDKENLTPKEEKEVKGGSSSSSTPPDPTYAPHLIRIIE